MQKWSFVLNRPKMATFWTKNAHSAMFTLFYKAAASALLWVNCLTVFKFMHCTFFPANMLHYAWSVPTSRHGHLIPHIILSGLSCTWFRPKSLYKTLFFQNCSFQLTISVILFGNAFYINYLILIIIIRILFGKKIVH